MGPTNTANASAMAGHLLELRRTAAFTQLILARSGPGRRRISNVKQAANTSRIAVVTSSSTRDMRTIETVPYATHAHAMTLVGLFAFALGAALTAAFLI